MLIVPLVQIGYVCDVVVRFVDATPWLPKTTSRSEQKFTSLSATVEHVERKAGVKGRGRDGELSCCSRLGGQQ